MANFDGIFPNATFTRASVAYLTDGTSVASGVPRYVDGKFGGKGIWIEEGTTNRINNVTFTGWTSYMGATVTLTQGQLDPFGGNGATRIQTSGGTHVLKYYFSSHTPASGEPWASQVWVKPRNGSVVIGNNLGVKQTVPAGSPWTLVTQTGVGGGAGNLQLRFEAETVDGVVDVDAYRPQLETKAYCTSFTAGTRSAETLTIPTTGLSPTQGTFEAWVYVNSMARRQANTPTVVSIPRTNGNRGIQLYHSSSSAFFVFETRDDSGSGKTASISDSFIPDGWRHIAFKWSVSDAKIFIDSVLRGTIINPLLPSGFAPNAKLGYELSTDYIGGYFDEVRISTITRTDAEILASYSATSKHTPDNYTQALLHFDNSLLSHEEVKAVLMPNGNLHIRGTKQIG